jgi:2-keto-4-pentenoate hydratase/2-oxohepta-3-ene-1,7-dioic acid hydratase in catechol pathway
LTKNGAVVQNDTTANMIWGIDEIISHVSCYFTLKIGDILFTGTPSGVGLVQKGDELTGQLAGQYAFTLKIK